MNKKKFFAKLIFLLLCLVSLLNFSVNAHPGRTDSNGGHWDRKAGTYHFHTGEYAGKSSSGSSSDTDYKPFTPPYDPPTNNPYRENNKTPSASDNRADNEWLSLIVWCALTTYIVVSIFTMLFSEFKDSLDRLLSDYANNISKYCDCKQAYLFKKSLINIEKKPTIPDEYEIDSKGLPKEKLTRSWGRTFTVYIAPNGKKFHRKRGCSRAYRQRNLGMYALEEIQNHDLKCSKCFMEFPLSCIDWYYKYNQYQETLNEIDRLRATCILNLEDAKKSHFTCNNTYKYKLLRLFPSKYELLKQLNQKYKDIQDLNQDVKKLPITIE